MFKRLISLSLFCVAAMPVYSVEIIDDYLPHTEACQDYARWVSYCYENNDPNICYGAERRVMSCIHHKAAPTYLPFPPAGWKPSRVSP